MLNNINSLKQLFMGDIDMSEETLNKYSHDASIFEIKPKVVVFPKNSDDVKILVNWVNKHKDENSTLSITARSAGTCMTGGAIGNSVIMDFTRYMNKIIEVKDDFVIAMPGCMYKDFDFETKKIGKYMPAYTASREINAIGGMVGNNSGGEKSIKYGKTENYINSLKIVLHDGNEYEIKPMTMDELEHKISRNLQEVNTSTEIELYRKIYGLINENYEIIMSAKPNVSKNSAGYYLWNVYDRKNKTFDLCRLIVGSQGTLGIVTEINFKIIPFDPCSNILVVFLPSLDTIGKLVNEILPYKPDSLETYDDKSMILAVKFFYDFIEQLGLWKAIKLGFQFIPETYMLAIGGVPKLILMIEFTGKNDAEVKEKLIEVEKHIKPFGFHTHIASSSEEALKYWKIRHESFNLLRKHTNGKRTVPFIDDIIVKPEHLAKFLPKVKALLEEYKLDYTVQGHLGNGNFHIIPFMDMHSSFSADIIIELATKIYDLVKEYKGSITAEHNDGIIRTPFLKQQFGDEIIKIFKEVKYIFDPLNIFNPGKKVDGTFDDIRKAIIKKN